MASRTNKRGIAAKKRQLQKQAQRKKGEKSYPKRKLSLEEAKQLGVVIAKENPAGHLYHRFARGRKVCRETRLRVDRDGYRLVKLPSGGYDFVQVPISGWIRKKLAKAARRSI